MRLILSTLLTVAFTACTLADDKRPNVLLAISDDISWPHASAYGSKMVHTPAFDRVAKEGVLFQNGFAASPGCSPARAALLTGLHTWQIEHAGTHASSFPKKYAVYPDQLEAAGYFVGCTGKAWAPGNWKIDGWERNPAGPTFNDRGGYVASFRKFLDARPKDQPFCFWFGSRDAHRPYEKGSGLKSGKKLDDAEVPSFLPDIPEVRSDLLDYAFEVDRFDRDVGGMLAILEELGELDNTVVIITSDNGMPFPRAKANLYEYGIRVPMAIRWPTKVPGGRTVDDPVGFVDLTATIYEATGVKKPADQKLVGKSLMPLLTSEKSGVVEPDRDAIFAARERHSSSRYRTLSYPQRCIRTRDYLYIRNFKPERWPAGTPQKYARVTRVENGEVIEGKLGPEHGGYHDIDGCPTLDVMIKRQDKFLALAVDRRPAEELFDIRNDPGCLVNLADDSAHADIKKQLGERLMTYLNQTDDARVKGNGDVWETYPRYSPIRWFPKPEWAEQNPDWIPKQDWLKLNK